MWSKLCSMKNNVVPISFIEIILKNILLLGGWKGDLHYKGGFKGRRYDSRRRERSRRRFDSRRRDHSRRRGNSGFRSKGKGGISSGKRGQYMDEYDPAKDTPAENEETRRYYERREADRKKREEQKKAATKTSSRPPSTKQEGGRSRSRSPSLRKKSVSNARSPRSRTPPPERRYHSEGTRVGRSPSRSRGARSNSREEP